jgi:hypothetical protein
MRERCAKERGNDTYICTIPPFLRYGRNTARYKGTWERHIYIGGSRGELRGQSVRGSQSLIITTSRPNDQGVNPPTWPRVMKPFSRAAHE